MSDWYEITDEALLSEGCPCASAHRCVADIQGRRDDVFIYDGRQVHPHVFRSALGRRAAIVESQVQQTHRGANIAVRCSATVDLKALREEITRALVTLGVPHPAIQIVAVKRLERDPGPAKLRRFVPLPADPRHDPTDSAFPAAASSPPGDRSPTTRLGHGSRTIADPPERQSVAESSSRD